jgi:hypothetical protein
MSFLGISRDSGAFYVGASPNFGYRRMQDPFVSTFRIVPKEGSPLEQVQKCFNLPKRVFCEELFDPSTRIRRGIVYTQDGSQPCDWSVQDPFRHDLSNAQYGGKNSRYEISLISYQSGVLSDLPKGTVIFPRVALGEEPYVTYWRILFIESSVSNAPVLTLKADAFFGVLPEIDESKVPEQARPKLRKLIESVADSVHGTSAASTVDRCRDCLSFIFGIQIEDHKPDLAKAIDTWAAKAPQNENIRAWCGRIVARLHSRGKPNEALSKNTRPLNDGDALLAVDCLATILREFGWAKPD